jgi:hypothetical protein
MNTIKFNLGFEVQFLLVLIYKTFFFRYLNSKSLIEPFGSLRDAIVFTRSADLALGPR